MLLPLLQNNLLGAAALPSPFTLANAFAEFNFAQDATYGFKLASFRYLPSGHLWTNGEARLWRIKVYDTTTAPLLAVAEYAPTPATLTSITPTTDSTGKQVVALWTLQLGPDTLQVTLTIRLEDLEDEITFAIATAWVGPTTRYTVDATCWGTVAIDPFNAGQDVAFCPAVDGIEVDNPITNLRYNPGGGRPDTPFGGGTLECRMHLFSGHGWVEGFFGYHEKLSREAWMVHVGAWSIEPAKVLWQSDGTRLVFELFQDQPDRVLVGNGGRAIGSKHVIRLRPMRLTQPHGWWDFMRHYKARLEAAAPSYLPAKLNQRTDLSTTEKQTSAFVAFQAIDTGHVVGDGKPGDVVGALQALRSKLGLPATIPLIGNVEAPSHNLHLVGEAADSDLRSKVAAAVTAGLWRPGLWFPDQIGPGVWDIHRWHQNLGDQAELRYFTTNEVEKSFTRSRRGFLEGGGADRLAESSDLVGIFHRVRTYPVSSWNAGTRTVTVSSGSPSADGFTGALDVVLVPASGAARLANARVESLGVSTVVLDPATAVFKDALGATVTPTGSDSIVVFFRQNMLGRQCFHAMTHKAGFLDRMISNSTKGIQAAWKACGMYFDTFPDPLLDSIYESASLCCEDHSAWCDTGYVRHPFGGGEWHKLALFEWLDRMRSAARAAQEAAGQEPHFPISSEFLDGLSLRYVAWRFHVIASGFYFRNTTGFDPAIHGMRAVPAFSALHAGRFMGRRLNEEFSSAIAHTAAPYNDATLRRYLGFCLLSEWVYGSTHASLSLFASDTVPLIDLCFDSIYAGFGGTVHGDVRKLRDAFIACGRAELFGGFLKWLRFGEFMSPIELDPAGTDFTTGMAQTPIWSAIGFSYDVLYPRDQFPRVIALPWRAADGSVGVAFANWTDTDAKWAGKPDTNQWGIGLLGSPQLLRTEVRRLDHEGRDAFSYDWNPLTGHLSLPLVPAYSVGIVVFQPALQTAPALVAAPRGRVFDLKVDVAAEGAGADLVLAGGDLELDRGLRTATLVSLFSDGRDDVSAATRQRRDDPRGWWPDARGDRFGSLLWKLEGGKRSPRTLDQARQWAQESLAWLVARGIAKRVEVTAEPIGTHGGLVKIVVHRRRGLSFDALWDNERSAEMRLGAFQFQLMAR